MRPCKHRRQSHMFFGMELVGCALLKGRDSVSMKEHSCGPNCMGYKEGDEMRIIRCDRNGEEVKDGYVWYELKIRKYNRDTHDYKYEICEKCMESLLDFMNPPRMAEKKDD